MLTRRFLDRLAAGARDPRDARLEAPLPPPQPELLLGIDLEDIRSLLHEGDTYAERVPANTERYLRFLDDHGMRCTFFTTGDVARRYPELVRQIVDAGHEVGCHSSDHTPVVRQTRESFHADVERNLHDLAEAGAHDIRGFRAPMLSITEQTAWAYDVLHELGFHYSSSVLAARGPMYDRPGFSTGSARLVMGIWELPASLVPLPGMRIPYLGGVYFRLLPFPVILWLSRREFAAGRPIVGYAHPYDIDTEQERFMFPEIHESRLLNHLMYMGRGKVLGRLRRLLELGFGSLYYRDYVARLKAWEGNDRSTLS
jgi:polysaccharide deacetylase family protein (PEP-CTERM system associated)